MNKIIKLIGCSLAGLSLQVSATTDQSEELAIKYSDMYGWLSILLESTEVIDQKCHSSNYRIHLKNEADYLLRSKTGYSYSDWGTKIADERYQKIKVNQAVDSMLSNMGGCDEQKLTSVGRVTSEKIQTLLLELTTLEDLDYLDVITRDESEIRLKLDEKISDFANLSLEEGEALIQALETGSYQYALYNPPIKIEVNKTLASKLKSTLESKKLAFN